MATDDNFIVAIELGSSKVSAVAGRKEPDGSIQVLAYAQESSENFVRKGRINNFNKMTQCIRNMKEKMESKLKKRISRVYVGIGGMGMHTVPNVVVLPLAEKTVVTNELVNNLKESNRSMPGNDRDIIDVVPQEYKLGAQVTGDPVGILTDSIEGRFLNVIASASVNNDVTKCFQDVDLKIAGMPITLLSLADVMLTEPQKRSGCVFVDMGAETTSVAVYKNNLLRHLAVIPLGGANINRDICTLQIENAEAESLKRQFGTAIFGEENLDHAPINLSDGRTVKYEEFCGLIEARVEEIILNIENQINLSKYDKAQLIAGIVVTGGAAALRGMDQAFAKHTGFDKISFVKNTHLQTRGDKAGSFNTDGSFNATLSIIDKAELNCCGGEIGSASDLFGEEATNEVTTSGSSETSETPQPAATTPEITETVPEPKKSPSTLRRWFSRAKDIAGRMVSEEDEGNSK